MKVWRRGLPAVLFGLCALAPLASSADAATRTKLDRGNELRFTLSGSVLTLAIVDRPNFIQSPTIQSELLGKRIWVGCSTSFRSVKRHTVASARVGWPQGAESISVHLDRDISRRARWCLVEGVGRLAFGDIAYASFYEAEPGRRLTSGRLRDGTRWGARFPPCSGPGRSARVSAPSTSRR